MSEFEYVAPDSMEEALQLLNDKKRDVLILAGGTNVLPNIRAKKIDPSFVMDINKIHEIKNIVGNNGQIRIGSTVKISEIQKSPMIDLYGACLSEASNSFGNPLIRNLATIGGNLANGSPAADMAVPLLALEAKLELGSHRGGCTEISLEDFFIGPGRSILKEKKDEMILNVSFEKPKKETSGRYIKFGLRKGFSISIASVAVSVNIGDKLFTKARIAAGSVAPTPIRLHGVEAMLEGAAASVESIEKAADKAEDEIAPITDIRGTSEYRRHVFRAILRKSLVSLLGES